MRITLDTSGSHERDPKHSVRRADHLGCQGANSDGSYGGSALPGGQKSGEVETPAWGDPGGSWMAQNHLLRGPAAGMRLSLALSIALAGLAIVPRAAAEEDHRVRRGETWSGIARRHGATAAALAAANRKTSAGPLREVYHRFGGGRRLAAEPAGEDTAERGLRLARENHPV